MKKKEIIEILKNGGVGVLPTDTLYGLVGSALDEDAVKRIYDLKNRDQKKALIILISDISELNQFGAEYNEEILEKYWPGAVSIILPVVEDKVPYLIKEDNSLAFRLPADKELINILKETGPLVAPSANPEGEEPAKKIEQAKEYFGDNLDFYFEFCEGQTLTSPASKIIKIKNGKEEFLRK